MAVHFHTDTWRQTPRFYVTRDRARQWRDAGLVVFGNRAKAIMLTFLIDERLRGASCTPGPQVMVGNAAGRQWALEIVQAWKQASVR